MPSDPFTLRGILRCFESAAQEEGHSGDGIEYSAGLAYLYNSVVEGNPVPWVKLTEDDVATEKWLDEACSKAAVSLLGYPTTEVPERPEGKLCNTVKRLIYRAELNIALIA